MAKTDILLHHVFLKNRVTELGIKQWWSAEQIGVDRKTVIRWTQGQVKSIQLENAEKLAKILNCSVADLTFENEAEKLASPGDQKAAAAALINSSLVEKLGPIGEWDVIESLLKATIVPNLPLNILGELYDKLTIASWRQSKIDQAHQYNVKTEDIARKTDDRTLLASALISKANIFSWRGHVTDAIKTYKDCLTYEKYVEPKTLGAIYSNLGGTLYESGNLSDGEKSVKKSIEIFQTGGKPLNLSISHCHLALIYLELGKIDEAERETQLSIQFAKQDDYRRGLAQGKLLLAEVAAHRGQSKATSLAEEALRDFEALGISEGLNYEQAGRVYHRLHDFDKAESYFRKGISLSRAFPVYQAALFKELGLVLKAKNDPKWKEELQNSIDLYKKCQCPLRAEMVQRHVT
jgi:tetratricopeptide (TPR) repeat protein